jgi:hypothetical protein
MGLNNIGWPAAAVCALMCGGRRVRALRAAA